MDELIDILHEDGSPTGTVLLKSEAHQRGLFHPTVHVWFYTNRGEVLLQQRGKNKATHPLLWDVSVAGHIAAGEAYEIAAVREVLEEIGLTIKPEQLEKIAVIKAMHTHPNGIQDNEFHQVYLCALTVPLSQLTKQESEVKALQLKPLLRFAEEIWGLAQTNAYVPHGSDYYKLICKEIQARLKR
ncbi:hydrolase [Croceivirga radicis]|uniref:Hydrolase n=1 Tax=Croceivirga radicis TaxID=1929488 RepID=A0A1V6LTA7_9FLAO|nr:NUDIX domain-containing protein [Croceivirga radicis]OQD43414.1 hydrolase [Croceivirga radicis]